MPQKKKIRTKKVKLVSRKVAFERLLELCKRQRINVAGLLALVTPAHVLFENLTTYVRWCKEVKGATHPWLPLKDAERLLAAFAQIYPRGLQDHYPPDLIAVHEQMKLFAEREKRKDSGWDGDV